MPQGHQNRPRHRGHPPEGTQTKSEGKLENWRTKGYTLTSEPKPTPYSHKLPWLYTKPTKINKKSTGRKNSKNYKKRTARKTQQSSPRSTTATTVPPRKITSKARAQNPINNEHNKPVDSQPSPDLGERWIQEWPRCMVGQSENPPEGHNIQRSDGQNMVSQEHNREQRLHSTDYSRLVFCALFWGPLGPTGPHTLEFLSNPWVFCQIPWVFCQISWVFYAKFFFCGILSCYSPNQLFLLL